jgi:hypothetical protein
MGLHVIKGTELLRQIANSTEVCKYTYAAIAVQDREQAETLQGLWLGTSFFPYETMVSLIRKGR